MSRSDLFPHKIDIARSPLLSLNSSIHMGRFARESGSSINTQFTTNVKYKNCTNCILQVRRNQTSESLLASCIPKLQSACCALIIDIFPCEIDSDCGLRYLKSTFSFSSNELLTNLSMMLVLPVPLSPRKIIL